MMKNKMKAEFMRPNERGGEGEREREGEMDFLLS